MSHYRSVSRPFSHRETAKIQFISQGAPSYEKVHRTEKLIGRAFLRPLVRRLCYQHETNTDKIQLNIGLNLNTNWPKESQETVVAGMEITPVLSISDENSRHISRDFQKF
jgi:hypothetical protein